MPRFKSVPHETPDHLDFFSKNIDIEQTISYITFDIKWHINTIFNYSNKRSKQSKSKPFHIVYTRITPVLLCEHFHAVLFLQRAFDPHQTSFVLTNQRMYCLTILDAVVAAVAVVVVVLFRSVRTSF